MSDRSDRNCDDFRLLNRESVPSQMYLPLVDAIPNWLGKMFFYFRSGKCVLESKIDNKSREETSFTRHKVLMNFLFYYSLRTLSGVLNIQWLLYFKCMKILQLHIFMTYWIVLLTQHLEQMRLAFKRTKQHGLQMIFKKMHTL